MPASALPKYTVLVALHDEAEILPDLVRRLSKIDYPEDKLDGMLLLEAHDRATIEAAETAEMPSWLAVVVVPPGSPTTKPRALNHGLVLATGSLLTVFDAEDEPHPQQLREAAARFAGNSDQSLACLQAPLRVRVPERSESWFLDRQFAAEYGSLFEVILPGLARLGLPLPLGGTSNHFRVSTLEAVNGWDSWNVTEDADLGFALWRRGWRLGVLSNPTFEPPPGSLRHWLPQRTRWLKGYMQTFGVQSQRLIELGPVGFATLLMTLGVSLLSAAIHAVALAWVFVCITVALHARTTPILPTSAATVLLPGAGVACLTCWIGSRRAGTRYGPLEIVMAPLYWSLLTLAFWHAVWRLVFEPFKWNKTCHRALVLAVPRPCPDAVEQAGRQAA